MASHGGAAAAPFPSLNQRVLVLYGPCLYEAKIIDFRPGDANREESFLVHYIKWSKDWDEWVPSNRILEYNSENLERKLHLDSALKSAEAGFFSQPHNKSRHLNLPQSHQNMHPNASTFTQSRNCVINEMEGEYDLQCGICLDYAEFRGALDCCDHFFCFKCIDEWCLITNKCPLCQKRFRFISRIPLLKRNTNPYSSMAPNSNAFRVNDTSYSSSNRTLSSNSHSDNLPEPSAFIIDDRDQTAVYYDDALPFYFPSYYIDEHAVQCLNDDCLIRKELISSEDNISVACDKCDEWFHAECVNFDSENNSQSFWHCPLCIQKTLFNLDSALNSISIFNSEVKNESALNCTQMDVEYSVPVTDIPDEANHSKDEYSGDGTDHVSSQKCSANHAHKKDDYHSMDHNDESSICASRYYQMDCDMYESEGDKSKQSENEEDNTCLVKTDDVDETMYDVSNSHGKSLVNLRDTHDEKNMTLGIDNNDNDKDDSKYYSTAKDIASDKKDVKDEFTESTTLVTDTNDEVNKSFVDKEKNSTLVLDSIEKKAEVAEERNPSPLLSLSKVNDIDFYSLSSRPENPLLNDKDGVCLMQKGAENECNENKNKVQNQNDGTRNDENFKLQNIPAADNDVNDVDNVDSDTDTDYSAEIDEMENESIIDVHAENSNKIKKVNEKVEQKKKRKQNSNSNGLSSVCNKKTKTNEIVEQKKPNRVLLQKVANNIKSHDTKNSRSTLEPGVRLCQIMQNQHQVPSQNKGTSEVKQTKEVQSSLISCSLILDEMEKENFNFEEECEVNEDSDVNKWEDKFFQAYKSAVLRLKGKKSDEKSDEKINSTAKNDSNRDIASTSQNSNGKNFSTQNLKEKISEIDIDNLKEKMFEKPKLGHKKIFKSVREKLTKKLRAGKSTYDWQISFWKKDVEMERKRKNIMQQVQRNITSGKNNGASLTHKTPPVKLNIIQNSTLPRNLDGSEIVRPLGIEDQSITSKVGEIKSMNKENLLAPKIQKPEEKMEKNFFFEKNEEVSIQKEKAQKLLFRIVERKNLMNTNAKKQSFEKCKEDKVQEFSLLIQLPDDMRPEIPLNLKSNIPTSVRQKQLNRLIEHALRESKISDIGKNADCEKVVSDCIETEKNIFLKSLGTKSYLKIFSRHFSKDDADQAETNASSEKTSHTDEEKKIVLLTDITHLQDDTQTGSQDGENGIQSKNSSETATPSKETTSIDDKILIAWTLTGLTSSESPDSSPARVEVRVTTGENRDDQCKVANHCEKGNDLFEVQKNDQCRKVFDNACKVEDANDHAADGNKTKQEQDVILEIKMMDEKAGKDAEQRNRDDHSLAAPDDIQKNDGLTLSSKREIGSEIFKMNQKNQENGKHVEERNEMEEGTRKNESKKRKRTTDRNDSKEKVRNEAGENPEAVKNNSKGDSNESSDKILNQVRRFVCSYLDPYFKSGTISSEQFKRVVERTSSKVMQYHSKETDAQFLLVQGNNVKKLADKYLKLIKEQREPDS